MIAKGLLGTRRVPVGSIQIGIAVTDLGTSSMRYAIGIFREDEDLASAQGFLVHVAVARATGRPVPLPDGMRKGLETIKR